jgi:aspartate kinase
MDIIVQKFGGTSVATEELRKKVASKVVATKESGKNPIVVVSAIGRRGDKYATDTLVNMATSVYDGDNARDLDIIMSVGEIISSVILSNTIKAMGYEAQAVTGFQAGIITDNHFGDADVLKVDNKYLMDLLNKGIIPVVAGFQGVTETGEITTLGRGGSDTTAAILGEALQAKCVEIYTDVDGVMTADPRVVTKARVIDEIDYEEIYQMADEGAKVVHPRAVAVAKRSNIPMKVKNTLNESKGTIIIQKNHYLRKFRKSLEEDNVIRAIAHKNNISQVSVYFNDNMEDNDILMNNLTKFQVSIDLINFFTDKKVFTIDNKDLDKVKNIMGKNKYEYSIIENCSKVTAIGHKIRGIPGVMGKIVKALSHSGIKILQSSDSHTTISCLIKEEHIEKAVNALHAEFNLDK